MDEIWPFRQIIPARFPMKSLYPGANSLEAKSKITSATKTFTAIPPSEMNPKTLLTPLQMTSLRTAF